MFSDKFSAEDLPWLVNGSLEADELAAAHCSVKESAELGVEQEFLSALRHSVKRQSLGDAPLEMGWHRLRRDIRSSKSSSGREVSYRWRLAAIAVSVFLLVQSLMIWLPGDSKVRFRPLASSITETTLLVRFADSAPQAHINKFLRQQHLRIVDGPSAVGLYRLTGDIDPEVALVALQKKSELVTYVQVD